MKLTIERAALLKSLGHVQSVVERRNTIPILSNVLMRTAGGSLSLTATDMDLEIVESVPADVVREGAVTAPAHTLYDIARKLPEGSQVELDWTGEAHAPLSLRAGRSSFKLGCLPVEDFPTMAGGDMPNHFAMPASDLRQMIDRTRFAISTEETRYYLNGIYLHASRTPGEGEPLAVLRAVATDGHRLARVETALPRGAEEIPGVIVPRKTVTELRKLLDEAGETIEVSLSDAKVRFAFGEVVLTSKLIDGTFPDYERVIPAGNDKVLTVAAKPFAAAVDRVSTIATEKSRAVKLSLEAGTLTLSATSAEQGSATEELEVDYDAQGIEIGFNARYLLDITQQIEGEDAQFSLADAASPTIVRDAADGSALYVLMPMRV
ncbi:MAG TPA: DNA polymerase III subunit beta [Alphaproteobacteria bacterium]|nr:DNA polymerase III subunit beta [Alphaproteobacteria bacterium]